MKVLFIGGTGIISSACSQLAVENNIELFLLNRGLTKRPIPDRATVLHADIRKPASVSSALEGKTFDVVVDWIAYTPKHIETDLKLFKGRVGQYIFISSASVYQKPPLSLPIVESTPLYNPYWEYSQNKIACEAYLMRAYQDFGFPITIVRPSHTYDRTYFPVHGGYTVVNRMRTGKPIIIHGDGTSLWVLTHHRDFAQGFLGLLGNQHVIGDVFHITSDEILTWNQIFQTIARAAGVNPQFVHIPSDFIARFDPEWGASLLGDKSHSVIFDNQKIKRIVPNYVAKVPFERGAREIVAWHDADPARRTINHPLDKLMDKIIASYQKALS